MANKEPSQRQLMVGQEIKRIIATMIQNSEIHNVQDFGVLITIMEAKISPDLKYCNIYFVTSNPSMDEPVLEGLTLAKNYIRKQISARTKLRYVPELVFRIDDTLEKVDEIERLLQHPKVAADLAKKD